MSTTQPDRGQDGESVGRFLISSVVAVVVAWIYYDLASFLAIWLVIQQPLSGWFPGVGHDLFLFALYCFGCFILSVPLAFTLVELRPGRMRVYLPVALFCIVFWFTGLLGATMVWSGSLLLLLLWLASLAVLPLTLWLGATIGRARAHKGSSQHTQAGREAIKKDSRAGRRTFPDLFKGALLFGLVGPPLGSPVASIGMVLLTPDDALPMLAVILMGVPFSYLLGGIPGILVGLVAGLVRPALVRLGNCVTLGLLGGLVSLLVLGWRPGLPFDEPVPLLVAAAGWFGATLCALLFRPRPRRAAGVTSSPG